jgi:hypothetical protein
MSAETIAHAVKLMKQGRVTPVPAPADVTKLQIEIAQELSDAALSLVRLPDIEVIDASSLADSIALRAAEAVARGEAGVKFKASDIGTCLAPPWTAAVIGYSYESQQRMSATAQLAHGVVDPFTLPKPFTHGIIAFGGMLLEPWMAREYDIPFKQRGVTIEWSRVKWLLTGSLFAYGNGDLYGNVGGSLNEWKIPVYEDGSMADVDSRSLVHWPCAFDLMVLLHTLSICNASNVYLNEPHRPRPVAKRMARTGVRVTEVHVRSLKTSYRTAKGGVLLQPGVPLTSVRGHFAEYGPKYGKGLLFGKIEGRFWIPQYVRGTEECGVIDHTYVVE